MNKLQILYEYDKNFFSYSEIEKDLWRDLVGDARKVFKIFFDLENNESKKIQRIIIIPQTQWDHTECKFKCELYAVGGDWEVPVLYFRCQLISGYAFNMNKYRNNYFIYIPGKTEGNDHLLLGKNDWHAPNNDGYKDGIDPTPNEKKCWNSLKIYLKTLVDKEIERTINDTIQES